MTIIQTVFATCQIVEESIKPHGVEEKRLAHFSKAVLELIVQNAGRFVHDANWETVGCLHTLSLRASAEG